MPAGQRITKNSITRAARIYNTNTAAAKALGISTSGFRQACLRYSIESPSDRMTEQELIDKALRNWRRDMTMVVMGENADWYRNTHKIPFTHDQYLDAIGRLGGYLPDIEEGVMNHGQEKILAPAH